MKVEARLFLFLWVFFLIVTGIYLWASRADADRVYTDEWKTFVRGKYGTDPVLTFLDCPVVVDNLADEIVS